MSGSSENKPCVRGGYGPRDKHGRCQCAACVEFNRRRWRALNAKLAERKREWVLAHPEKARSYSRKWAAQNPQERRDIEQSWKERNAGRVREYNRKAGKKWAANNKGHRNAISKRRAVAKMHRTPSWADLDAIRAVYEEAARVTEQTGIPHEVDHIIPLQGERVSGLHVHQNLQVIERAANRSKRNRMPCEF